MQSVLSNNITPTQSMVYDTNTNMYSIDTTAVYLFPQTLDVNPMQFNDAQYTVQASSPTIVFPNSLMSVVPTNYIMINNEQQPMMYGQQQNMYVATSPIVVPMINAEQSMLNVQQQPMSPVQQPMPIATSPNAMNVQQSMMNVQQPMVISMSPSAAAPVVNEQQQNMPMESNHVNEPTEFKLPNHVKHAHNSEIMLTRLPDMVMHDKLLVKTKYHYHREVRFLGVDVERFDVECIKIESDDIDGKKTQFVDYTKVLALTCDNNGDYQFTDIAVPEADNHHSDSDSGSVSPPSSHAHSPRKFSTKNTKSKKQRKIEKVEQLAKNKLEKWGVLSGESALRGGNVLKVCADSQPALQQLPNLLDELNRSRIISEATVFTSNKNKGQKKGATLYLKLDQQYVNSMKNYLLSFRHFNSDPKVKAWQKTFKCAIAYGSLRYCVQGPQQQQNILQVFDHYGAFDIVQKMEKVKGTNGSSQNDVIRAKFRTNKDRDMAKAALENFRIYEYKCQK